MKRRQHSEQEDLIRSYYADNPYVQRFVDAIVKKYDGAIVWPVSGGASFSITNVTPLTMTDGTSGTVQVTLSKSAKVLEAGTLNYNGTKTIFSASYPLTFSTRSFTGVILGFGVHRVFVKDEFGNVVYWSGQIDAYLKTTMTFYTSAGGKLTDWAMTLSTPDALSNAYFQRVSDGLQKPLNVASLVGNLLTFVTLALPCDSSVQDLYYLHYTDSLGRVCVGERIGAGKWSINSCSRSSGYAGVSLTLTPVLSTATTVKDVRMTYGTDVVIFTGGFPRTVSTFTTDSAILPKAGSWTIEVKDYADHVETRSLGSFISTITNVTPRYALIGSNFVVSATFSVPQTVSEGHLNNGTDVPLANPVVVGSTVTFNAISIASSGFFNFYIKDQWGVRVDYASTAVTVKSADLLSYAPTSVSGEQLDQVTFTFDLPETYDSAELTTTDPAVTGTHPISGFPATGPVIVGTLPYLKASTYNYRFVFHKGGSTYATAQSFVVTGVTLVSCNSSGSSSGFTLHFTTSVVVTVTSVIFQGPGSFTPFMSGPITDSVFDLDCRSSHTPGSYTIYITLASGTVLTHAFTVFV